VIQKVGMIAVMNPPDFHQGADVVEEGLIVVAHPPWVVVDDVFERGRLIPDVQQLVHLLLISTAAKRMAASWRTKSISSATASW